MEVLIMELKAQIINTPGYKTYMREFGSLNAFYNYITTTPLNQTFQWEELGSVKNGYNFSQTNSFEEATELFKDGWHSMADQLVKKLSVVKNQVVDTEVKKVLYDVVGFQASVPRYLQGIPTNMINKRIVTVKQKVITLDKDISYNCLTNTKQIIEASTQVLLLIKKLEAQGIRVNLNLILGVKAGYTKEVVKVRIKSANERLNISKLAFPLVHPSMLRRLFFRYIEVAPTVTKNYKWGYGKPLDGQELKQYTKDEYLLPRLFDGNITQVGDLSTICNLTDKIVNGKNDAPKI